MPAAASSRPPAIARSFFDNPISLTGARSNDRALRLKLLASRKFRHAMRHDPSRGGPGGPGACPGGASRKRPSSKVAFVRRSPSSECLNPSASQVRCRVRGPCTRSSPAHCDTPDAQLRESVFQKTLVFQSFFANTFSSNFTSTQRKKYSQRNLVDCRQQFSIPLHRKLSPSKKASPLELVTHRMTHQLQSARLFPKI